tara:strand:+ start:572 stop:790 length:219 start_codon:yes stop_codon:yes gene_type:complete
LQCLIQESDNCSNESNRGNQKAGRVVARVGILLVSKALAVIGEFGVIDSLCNGEVGAHHVLEVIVQKDVVIA